MFDTFVKKKKTYLFSFFLIMISLYIPPNKNKPAQNQHNYLNHFTIKP